MNFPVNISKFRGLPINTHPGAFGCQRKYDIHTGIDLYGSTGDEVYAIEGGIIIEKKQFTGGELHWWLETDAIIVQSLDHFWCYGEISTDLKIGDAVKEGQKIASIVQVLRAGKERSDIPGHSLSMLHMELYDASYKPFIKQNGDKVYDFPDWMKHEDRPKYLLDPTPILAKLLSTNELKFL
jgi:murein DD-endopeptidase MepM/ murein hydrolase activator NlpD